MSTTGYKFAGTIVSETISGGNSTDWSNPSNAGADDTSYATWGVTTASSDVGPYLKFTNFGFTSSDIPSGATIDGIEVEYGRFEGSGTDNITTSRCRIVKGGTIHTANVSTMNTTEWATSIEVITEGGATNLWGLTWVDTDIAGSSTFGVAISPNGAGTTPDASFDYAKLRVYYTESSGVSGTAAVTTEAVSTTASGKVSINGTSAVTTEAVSTTASGKVSIVGTAAVTTENATAVASGTYRIPGSAAVTTEEATTTASGKVSIVGTAAVTTQDASVVASGALGYFGSASVTTEDAAVSASGKVSIVGSAAVTTENATVAASGNYTIFGTSAVTTEAASVAASGKVSIVGTASVTLDDATVAASGDVSGSTITGTADVTTEDASVTANGQVSIVGTADITTEDAGVVATGDVASASQPAGMRSRGNSPYPKKYLFRDELIWVRSPHEERELYAQFLADELAKQERDTPKQKKLSKRRIKRKLEVTLAPLDEIPQSQAAEPDYAAQFEAWMAQQAMRAANDDNEAILLLMMA